MQQPRWVSETLWVKEVTRKSRYHMTSSTGSSRKGKANLTATGSRLGFWGSKAGVGIDCRADEGDFWVMHIFYFWSDSGCTSVYICQNSSVAHLGASYTSQMVQKRETSIWISSDTCNSILGPLRSWICIFLFPCPKSLFPMTAI